MKIGLRSKLPQGKEGYMAEVEWKAAQAISIRIVTVILTEEELRDLEVT